MLFVYVTGSDAMPFDHLGFNVKDFARSRAFYSAALAPLGIGVQMEGDGYAGLGEKGKPELWITDGGPAPSRVHIAFRARDRAQVRAFYEAAIAAGGKDNGAPGLRPQYHANYYGAFVIDPDGHNVEAVCHAPA
jgi:catechol 2,3-dioxygenase-like lactoylglutathione lyase family enzyme